MLRSFISFTFFAVSNVYTQAGSPIDFIGYRNPSAPIFSKAGLTTINYQLYAEYTGVHKPGTGMDEGGFSVVTIRATNNSLLYSYPVPMDSLSGGFGGHTTNEAQPYLFKPYVLTTGSFQFSNPSDQKLVVEEQIFYSPAPGGLGRISCSAMEFSFWPVHRIWR
jgi:hypothetical protein